MVLSKLLLSAKYIYISGFGNDMHLVSKAPPLDLQTTPFTYAPLYLLPEAELRLA
jgi:hypothetical protein